MKKILITGQHGYVATSLKKYIDRKSQPWEVELFSLRDDWRSRVFADVDTVVHTAALVHKNERNIGISEYRKVNSDLTFEFAQNVKNDGVSHFIFMSTEAVYGAKASCFKQVVIDENTPLHPSTKYGITKLEAEKRLLSLESDDFKISIIRSPMIYGPGCPGNFQLLRKLCLNVGIAPKISAKKSFLFIDNLCELIFFIIQNSRSGLFFSQNREIVGAYEMMFLIGKCNDKHIVFSPVLNPFIKIASLFFKNFSKAFGSLYYSAELSNIDGLNYCIVPFEKSIELTERKPT